MADKKIIITNNSNPKPGKIQIVDNNFNVLNDVPGLEKYQKQLSADVKIDVNDEAVQKIVSEIKVEQSIETRHMNQTKAEKEQADQKLIELFSKGRGCNLTLFNPNVLKED